MLIYLAVVLVPLMTGSLYNESVKNSKDYIKGEFKDSNSLKLWVLISALPMFLLIALRHYSMGADTYVYYLHFLKTVDTPWNELSQITEMEQGFAVFVKILTLITKDPLVYQCICVGIYFFCFISFVNQLETDRFLVVFFFGTLSMYTFMFTAVRQCLAISLCLYSYKFIKNRRFIPFLILIILATLLHRSSFIFIVAYFIYSFELSAKNILIYIFSTIFFVIFLEAFQGWFNEQLDYDYKIESGAGGIIFAVAVLGMIIFSIIFAFQTGESKSHFTGIVNVGIIAAVFWVIRIFTRVAERPSFYFLTFVFTAVAYGIESLEDEKEKILSKYIIVVLAFVLFCYRLSNNVTLVPYKMFEL